jgi:hypothetical protein
VAHIDCQAIYLIHQQGTQGAEEHVNHPDSALVKKCRAPISGRKMQRGAPVGSAQIIAETKLIRRLLGWHPRFDNLSTVITHAPL